MKIFTSILTAATLVAGLHAQEATETPAKPRPAVDRAAKLQAACKTMTRLVSLGFKTTHQTTNRVSGIRIRGLNQNQFRKSAKTESFGVWHGGFLQFTVEDDDRFVFRNRQMIAADEDADWCLRRGKTASGKPLPFILDPQALFTTLQNLKFKVVHNEVGDIDGRPCEIYTVRLEETAARTLLWNGVVPIDDGKSTGGGANNFAMVQMIGAAAGARVQKPAVSIDLAISFDPATRMIYRVRGRSFTKGANRALRGNIAININGFGQGNGAEEEEEEEEEEEKAPAQKGGFKLGLPVPAKKLFKESTVMEFTYDFRSHNSAKMPTLEPAARKLLGLSSK